MLNYRSVDLNEIKQAIWSHRKIHRNPIDLQVEADKAWVRLPITQVHEAQKLLDSLNKRKKPTKSVVPVECVLRYMAAHKDWFSKQYPAAFKDGFYPGMEPDFPDTGTGNGLNKFMQNYLVWKGHRATRINVQGRLAEVNKKEASGQEFKSKKYIKSTTRKGAADISSTIHGRSCQWEGKAGRDKPRPEQIREQELERRAGGSYEFIHSPEEFFRYYDGLMVQGSIFV